MDSVKIKLTLLIDLYGALFKRSNVGKQLLNLSPYINAIKAVHILTWFTSMFLPFSCLKAGSLYIYFALSYGVM